MADASHELRTPFAVLRGELELAGRPGRSREELSAAVASAAEETDRLTRITDDLLLLARGDEATLSTSLARTDVALLLARSAERASTRAAAAGVTCRVDVQAGLMAVVDEGRIRQAVDNLIDNALRFAPRDSEVVICAEMAGPELVIEVRDRGPGFPSSFLPQAFERFARPDQGRARDGRRGRPGVVDRASDRARPRRPGRGGQPRWRRCGGPARDPLPAGTRELSPGQGPDGDPWQGPPSGARCAAAMPAGPP